MRIRDIESAVLAYAIAAVGAVIILASKVLRRESSLRADDYDL